MQTVVSICFECEIFGFKLKKTLKKLAVFILNKEFVCEA